MEIHLTEVVFALSDALDLVTLEKANHAKHVGYIALECGRSLGWDGEMLHDLLFSAMLHDCGITSSINYSLQHLRTNDLRVRQHAQRGFGLLMRFLPFKPIASCVLYHHTPWNHLRRENISERTAYISNCINLASYVEDIISSRPVECLLAFTEEIRQEIAGLRATTFAPELVDLFMEISAKESFWLLRNPEYITPRLKFFAQEEPQPMTLEILNQLTQIFARIVDAKSAFTAEHSQGVAKTAAYLGQECGLPDNTVHLLEIAGNLHDIGKLRVPNEILNKPDKLDKQEFAVIRRHSFDTYQILNSIRGLWSVCEMAAFHHETLNGTGYPFHVQEPLLSIEAKIVAVADVFQALAQKRPYRKDLPPDKILSILYEMVAKKQLSGDLVTVVEKNLDTCWRIATLKEK